MKSETESKKQKSFNYSSNEEVVPQACFKCIQLEKVKTEISKLEQSIKYLKASHASEIDHLNEDMHIKIKAARQASQSIQGKHEKIGAMQGEIAKLKIDIKQSDKVLTECQLTNAKVNIMR